MRDIRIYQDCELVTGESISLDERASRHLGQVLRLAVSDEVLLFNGDGRDCTARIDSISKKRIDINILSCRENTAESALEVHLYQGISKGDRMDTAIQKAVELGVSRIVPIVCERTVVRTSTERNEKKLSHWQNIVISACEQSGRARVPQIEKIKKFSDSLTDVESVQSILLHPEKAESLSAISLDARRINLFIGPEGGFSDQEIEQARQAGIRPVVMGKRVLRTETAPIAALAVLQSRFGDY